MASRLCLKLRYDDEPAALRALEDARSDRAHPRGRNVRKVEQRAYFHAPCQAWHLTSQKDKR